MPKESNKQDQTKNTLSCLESLIHDLKRQYPKNSQLQSANTIIIVSIAEQKLYLINNSKLKINYRISSAEKGHR